MSIIGFLIGFGLMLILDFFLYIKYIKENRIDYYVLSIGIYCLMSGVYYAVGG